MSDSVDSGGRGRKPDYAQAVASRLIEQIAQGTAPWQRPWEAQSREPPHNPLSGARYRGSNWLVLTMEQRADPRWMTFNQARDEGYSVRKGERGTSLTYWKVGETREKLDEQGNRVLGKDGKPETESVRYQRPRQYFFTVFNAEQIDGIAPHAAKPATSAYPAIDAAIEASGVRVVHAKGSGAYYHPGRDTIGMPAPDSFKSTEHYYSTALHELAHATGHEKRLGRDLSHPFGSEGYAKEELRAEIASMMLGEALGIRHDPSQHAAYVGSWMKRLADDPNEVFRAARDASGITDYVETLAASRTLEAEGHDPQLAARVERGEFSGIGGADAGTEVAPEILTARSSFRAADDWRTAASAELFAGLFDARRLAPTLRGENFAAVTSGLYRVGKQAAADDFTGALAEVKTMRGLVADGPLGEALDRMESGARMMATIGAAHRKERSTDNAEEEQQSTQETTMKSRAYLSVPYAERHAAKAAGARWDPDAKSWFAPDGADASKLARWTTKPSVAESQGATQTEVKQAFADALRARGLLLDGEPTMDGELHRVPVEHDKGAQRGGAYRGHLDGKTPAGYIENFRTGTKENWRFEGATAPLTSEETAALREAAKARAVIERAERDARHATMAGVYADLLAAAPIASGEHRYGAKKGVDVTELRQVPTREAFADREGLLYIAADGDQAKELRKEHKGAAVLTGGDLIVPLHSADGELTGIQTIAPSGFKMYAAGGTASGSFYKIDGDPSTVATAEGWATARTIADATGWTVYAAMSSSNIESVVRTARDQLPDAVHVICGDDDRSKEQEGKRNAGRAKAVAAGEETQTRVAFPPFGADEKGTDWNDYAKTHGVPAVGKALAVERELAVRAALVGQEAKTVDIGAREATKTQAKVQGTADQAPARARARASVNEPPAQVDAPAADKPVKRAGRSR